MAKYNWVFFTLTKWFLFYAVYYNQIDCVKIGSSLGVTQFNFDPSIIVETLIIIMFEHKGHEKKFLRYMNSRHRNIQFTCQEENFVHGLVVLT